MSYRRENKALDKNNTFVRELRTEALGWKEVTRKMSEKRFDMDLNLQDGIANMLLKE